MTAKQIEYKDVFIFSLNVTNINMTSYHRTND